MARRGEPTGLADDTADAPGIDRRMAKIGESARPLSSCPFEFERRFLFRAGSVLPGRGERIECGKTCAGSLRV